MRKHPKTIGRMLASAALGLTLAGGVIASPADARPVFKNQAHMQDQCERAGGTWERVRNFDGSLAGFRCVFPNGDQIWCGLDWTDAENCVYLPAPHEKPAGETRLSPSFSYDWGPTKFTR